MFSQRRRRGQALVELALTLPILLLLVLGILEFGYATHQKLILSHASREAARAMALGEPSAFVSERIQALAGDTWNTCDLSVRCYESGTMSFPTVTVSITAPLKTLTPLGCLTQIAFDNGRVTGQSVFHKEG
jgi:Flp pilus assembly protein TadG